MTNLKPTARLYTNPIHLLTDLNLWFEWLDEAKEILRENSYNFQADALQTRIVSSTQIA